ncbi:Small ribosomal subunit protein S13 [Citrus sinensis]|nr:Small ribosomal subunit protein S13 [Citrus sinensis]
MISLRNSVGMLSNVSRQLIQTISHVYGIGRSRAHQILCDLNIGNKLTKELTGVELNSLREEVSRYLTGEDLRRCIKNDVERLVDIQCYRGIRHSQGLPCRGQRTSTNARTRKGKRVAIPGKKKPTR